MDLIQIILIVISIITIILTIVLFVVSKSKINAIQKKLISNINTIQNNLDSKTNMRDVRAEIISMLTDKENPIKDPQFVNVTLHNGRIYWDGLSYNIGDGGKKYPAAVTDVRNMSYITMTEDLENKNDCEKGGCFVIVRNNEGPTTVFTAEGKNIVTDPEENKKHFGNTNYTASYNLIDNDKK